MKKLYLLFYLTSLALLGFSQPNEYTQPINPKDSVLISSPDRREWSMQFATGGIVVDGVKDALWDNVESKTFDRYILGSTALSNGIYSFQKTHFRERDSETDFSGSFRIAYDSDYVYTFYDITDNQVNDGTTIPGVFERLEFVEAPYPDSADQLLTQTFGVTKYPPFLGAAPEINKKFCYWAYLGAFKINYEIIENGKCNIFIDEREDARTKIDYGKRTAACKCAWVPKSDKTGYILEAAFSFKVTLADSADVPYQLPKKGETKKIAFDLFVLDYDDDLDAVKASWNAQDDIVRDAMLFTGKLTLFGWSVGINDALQNEIVSFYPNPSVNEITFTKMADVVEIISMNGTTVKRALNASSMNVQNLSPGIYIIKVNGKAIGKMLKEQ